MGRLSGSTVLVLTGVGLRNIDATAALARRLAPTLVVVEDVDLIAADRSATPHGNPLLFSLLDAMDGVAADADVTFVLTTNRADVLEEALIQRPGRIDLAVEVPRPDADGRRALARLYSGRAQVTADLTPLVEATAGATASAIKELMRRAVLAALAGRADGSEPDGGEPGGSEAGGGEPGGGAPVVTDAVLREVLADFTRQQQALSRAVLGGSTDTTAPGDDPDETGRPGGWQWGTCAPPDQL